VTEYAGLSQIYRQENSSTQFTPQASSANPLLILFTVPTLQDNYVHGLCLQYPVRGYWCINSDASGTVHRHLWER
jgi:hypothetical protein